MTDSVLLCAKFKNDLIYEIFVGFEFEMLFGGLSCYSSSHGDCVLYDIRPKLILNPNLGKSRSPITSLSVL